jgi:hypothetical protein
MLLQEERRRHAARKREVKRDALLGVRMEITHLIRTHLMNLVKERLMRERRILVLGSHLAMEPWLLLTMLEVHFSLAGESLARMKIGFTTVIESQMSDAQSMKILLYRLVSCLLCRVQNVVFFLGERGS